MKPFADRSEAGKLLADSIRHPPCEVVVLALPRGGVPVAFEIARKLYAPLDVIVVRKLGVPWQPELAMGAIAGPFQMLDRSMITQLGIRPPELERSLAKERVEARRQETLFREGRRPLDLNSRTVILADDGLATGSSMEVAIQCARSLSAARIIVAAPVGAREACRKIERLADQLICLHSPEPFQAVGEWYADFRQVTDAEVQHLLQMNHEHVSTAEAVQT